MEKKGERSFSRKIIDGTKMAATAGLLLVTPAGSQEKSVQPPITVPPMTCDLLRGALQLDLDSKGNGNAQQITMEKQARAKYALEDAQYNVIEGNEELQRQTDHIIYKAAHARTEGEVKYSQRLMTELNNRVTQEITTQCDGVGNLLQKINALPQPQ